MRITKSPLFFLFQVCMILFTVDASCQLNRAAIKRNNRRLATYRGPARPFEKKYNSVGLSINALNYYGDITPLPKKISTDISLTQPGISVFLNHRKGPRYSLQASFSYGIIKGSDNKSARKLDADNGIYRYQRNLSFRNRIKELAVVGMFDLFDNHGTYMHRSNWTPYVFAGIAVFHHNPQARVPSTDLNGNRFSNRGKWIDLQPLGTEGQKASLKKGDSNHGIKPYNRIQAAIPFGAGVRVRIRDQFDFSAEFSFRYLFTDYLDDVSQNYVDLGALGSELARALSYRSNEVAVPNHSYTSAYNGKTYTVVSGYGSEHKTNIRGNKKDKDVYTMFSLKLGYILKGRYYLPKSR